MIEVSAQFSESEHVLPTMTVRVVPRTGGAAHRGARAWLARSVVLGLRAGDFSRAIRAGLSRAARAER